MKYFLFLLSFFLLNVSFAQQNSLMQPAIINSDQKLDSVNILSQPIFNKGFSMEQKTEKWVVNQYDSYKNPTELMVYYYGYSNGADIIDSIKVSLEHYNHNQYITDFRGGLYGSYKEWIDPLSDNGIYHAFNLKSITEKICNPTTGEWVPFYITNSLNDIRLPGSCNTSRTEYFYDVDFNLINIGKVEGVEDGMGYWAEQIIYSWDATIGFTPIYKNVFNNTYDGNNQLIEVIKKEISDLSTGEEMNILKYSFVYTSNLFEYTTHLWDDISGEYVQKYKTSIEYDAGGMPVLKTNYHWDIDQWVPYESYSSYYFNDGLYVGYSVSIPITIDEDFTITYDDDDLVILEELYSIWSPPPMSGGYYEGKEYYYSFDNGIGAAERPINQLVLYPNPTHDVLHIKTNDKVSYKIYTIEGKTLKVGATFNQINIADFSKGVYFIELALNDDKHYSRFIVR